MKRKNKTKPVIFIYLVIAIVSVSYIAGILPFGLFLSLIVYSGLYLIVLKERKTVKILADLVILNFLIVYYNLLELIKRKLMSISRSLLFLKILIFLDYKLPIVLNRLYKKAYSIVYSILLFLSVKLPRKIRRAVKLILKTIVYSVIDSLDLAISFVLRLYKKTYAIVYSILLFLSVKLPRKTRRTVKFILKTIIYSVIYFIELVVFLILKSAFAINSIFIKLFNLINSFISRLRLIINKLTAVYLSKKAALTRFAGIAVFVLIILFFFIGVKPNEESIKFVGAFGENCGYDVFNCSICEFCNASDLCEYIASGDPDTFGDPDRCNLDNGCSATSGDYCRCNGTGSCLTLDNGSCTDNAYCFNDCDAEDGTYETLYGKNTDNLVCFSGVACEGGQLFCGSHDEDCQFDPGADNNCDDYSEGSDILSGDPGYPGSCDANCGYHAEGAYKFYVKNSTNDNIASFDDVGNVTIKGILYESSAIAPPYGNDDFIIQNSTADWVAWIDGSTGSMYLTGTMTDGQASVTPPANSFIIQNSGGTNVSYIDSNGNLGLIGAFVQGGIP